MTWGESLGEGTEVRNHLINLSRLKDWVLGTWASRGDWWAYPASL